ncbi:MAG: hypothetical protein WBS19_01630 [Candidatus Korobacteraceae bacterium]
MTLARWLILLGSIVMFVGALLHILGGSIGVFPVLRNAGIAPLVAGAIKCVWLVVSAHGLLLAPALVWISRLPGTGSLLRYLALIPLVDAVLMYVFVGFFAGFYLVSASALFLLIGAWLPPRNQNA